jgi:hypothetical protein
MIRANVVEDREATMARFLNGMLILKSVPFAWRKLCFLAML